ncbi:hypothetical protein [Mycolicibacterium sp.]|uniref:hypothetical protein n=1 Tax=Mycolicibacterium sp. TaxID=2320850 RepID=UPI0037CBA8BE
MSLAELQRALDQLGVACWFHYLPRHARFWETRHPEETESVLNTAEGEAVDAGATPEQIQDCHRYAKSTASTGGVPLTLGGRTWDQFGDDVRHDR